MRKAPGRLSFRAERDARSREISHPFAALLLREIHLAPDLIDYQIVSAEAPAGGYISHRPQTSYPQSSPVLHRDGGLEVVYVAPPGRLFAHANHLAQRLFLSD